MAEVRFPLAGPQPAIGALRVLTAQVDLAARATVRLIAFPPHVSPPAVEAVLAATRPPDRLAEPVFVRYRALSGSGDFEGRSYELALALADRLLLAGAAGGRRLHATGTIPPGRGGQVGAVEELGTKLVFLAEAVCAAGDVLFFPLANLRALNAEGHAAIARARQAGVLVHAIGHIEEASFLWAAAKNA
ncbi:hypothetical protein [Falsiroseomonas ponticola]|uniref:hypothetical protein n=1 Tax=Falsiroseomonas ponticola TaxID=2786951 RepID=UPI00193238BB|nr:hypothetical protein [Roseomonas ponticola]